MRTRLKITFASTCLLAATTGAVAQAPTAASAPASAATPNPQVTALLEQLRKGAPQVKPFSAAEIDRVQAGKGLTDCFWVGTLSHDTFNILIPDLGVVYWVSQFRLPAGSSLELKGQYPRARYLSFASYNPMGQPVDSLNDQLIQPDAGSTNPFLPGAARASAKRSYTITLAARALQAGQRVDESTRARNTLYLPAGDADLQLWMRVYVPDQGLNAMGGVPLPAPQLTLADGRKLEGDALCREIVRKDGAVRAIVSTPEGNRETFRIPGARAPYHPAQPGPVPWQAFFNPQATVGNVLINTPFEALRTSMDYTRRAGFYSTLDNVYMSSYVDNRYGDALVVRGKAPRTPRTWKGNPTMNDEVDLRYWSLCKYRSIADGAADDCVYDEQAPLDAHNRYTIVVSTPEVRPANARPECGVAWMNWGVGDGIGNPHGGFLAFRHMLPSAGFKNSLWATHGLGDERRALGDYYPEATYEAKPAFEARGCPVR